MAIIDKIQLSGTVYTIGNETTTAVTSASTDNEIPTAKAVYDAIPQGGGGKAISAGTNISITTGDTADTINCTLPITASTSIRKNDIAIGNDIINGAYSYSKITIGNGNKFQYGSSRAGSSILIGTPSNNSSVYNVVKASRCIGIGGDELEVGYDNFNGYGSIAIGYGAKSNINKSLAIGYHTVASGTTQTNINNQLTIDTSNQVYIYNKDNTEMICLQDQLGGGGGSITIDQSLDSGSTNPVANSAITNAINSKMDEVNFASFYGNQYSAGLKGYYYDSQTETQTEKFNWGMVWQSDGSIGFDALGNLAVFNKLDTSAITTSVTSSSTDSQVPSAKAVYDQLDGLKLVKLSQSEYDSLSTKDSSTLYIING